MLSGHRAGRNSAGALGTSPRTMARLLAPWQDKGHRPQLPQLCHHCLRPECHNLLPFTYVFLLFLFLLVTTMAWSLAVNT